jgi:hypothetical protein
MPLLAVLWHAQAPYPQWILCSAVVVVVNSDVVLNGCQCFFSVGFPCSADILLSVRS